MKNFASRSGMVAVLVLLSSCQDPSRLEIERAEKHRKAGNLSRALSHYERAITRGRNDQEIVMSAFEGASLAEHGLKDFQRAVTLYKVVIDKSTKKEERIRAQQAIAEIVFTHKSDYKSSIKEISRLLGISEDPQQISEYRLKLAKSHFFLKDFFQSEIEVKRVLTQTKDADLKFAASILLGNIMQARQLTAEATRIFEKVFTEFPVRAQRENIGMNLALTFEERGEFDRAIEIFQKMRDGYPNPDFIDRRIQRLRQRQQNLPGAGGLKR